VSDVAARVASVKDRYEGCFGCGRDNAIGLRLDDFQIEDDVVRASFLPRPEYRGFDGILHGGIVATALDEMLGWTAILVDGVLAVTAKLELRYRNPAPADIPYRLEGRVADRRGKRLILEANCTAGDQPIADARGVFLVTGPAPGV
jgi:acyl-coenzyme A thioesterase PaaI-like protein